MRIEKSALESLAEVKDQSAVARGVWQIWDAAHADAGLFGAGKLSKEEKPSRRGQRQGQGGAQAALEERSKAVRKPMLAKSLEEECWM